MNRFVMAAGYLLVAGAIYPADTGDIRRVEGFWIREFSGAQHLAGVTTLRISTSGAIEARGVPGDALTWRATVRVKAAGEQQARARLNAARITVDRSGAEAHLAAHETGGDLDLVLQLPSKLSHVLAGTSGGPIQISRLNGKLTAKTAGGAVNLDDIGGDVSVWTAGGDIVIGQISGNANCMSGGGTIRARRIGGDAAFETGGGEIVVEEAARALRAYTAGGGIRVTRAHSTVAANTAGGLIEIGSAAGEVAAKNMGGPISIGSANGVKAESGGGSIKLTNAHGSLRASTAMGSISAQLTGGAPLSESFLVTGSGDVTVLIPSNLGVTIQARNDSVASVRQINSDFPNLQIRLTGSSAIAEGEINGGGPLLRIAGHSGTISIRRLK